MYAPKLTGCSMNYKSRTDGLHLPAERLSDTMKIDLFIPSSRYGWKTDRHCGSSRETEEKLFVMHAITQIAHARLFSPWGGNVLPTCSQVQRGPEIL